MSSPCSPTASASASRRTRPTPARSRSTPHAPRSGCRSRPTSPRAPPSGSSSSTARATGLRSPRCSCRPPARRGSACSPRPDCSGRGSWRRTASHVDAEEIALLARARRRGRALPALERATSAAASRRSQELLAAGVTVGDRDGQPRVDAVARPVRGAARRDRGRARARADGPTPSPPPRRSSSRRSAAHACSASTADRLARARASRPTSRSSRSRTRRSIPLKILLWPPSSAGRPTGSQLLS